MVTKRPFDLIEEAWGFCFPDDLGHVWRVACAVDKRHPLTAFQDTIGVRLEGPFVVLDGGKPEKDLGRWTSDPPELFTVASGDVDGLHWGYVVHEPGKTPGIAAHFHARDGYPITLDGTLFGSLGQWLADVRGELEDELAQTVALGERDEEIEKRIAEIDRQLRAFDAEKKRIKPVRSRALRPVATTLDGLGIVCPKRLWASPGLSDQKLAAGLRDPKKRAKLIARARELIAKGKAGGALKIARDLLAVSPEKQLAPAVELLTEVYGALNRPVLARAIRSLVLECAPPKPKGPLRCSTLAEALEDLPSVESLAITYHSHDQTPPGPEHFAAMTRLTTLVLRGMKLADLPIAGLPIERLELFHVCLRRFPKAMRRMPRLTNLILNEIGVRLPEDLAYPKLERLEIARLGLDRFPSFVTRAKHLYNLSLYYNRIEQVPADLGKLIELRYLNLQNNRIAQLPDVFDRLPKLASLWLESNQLKTLPESIGKLRGTLKTLSIGKNPLTKNAAERARIKALLPKTKIYWT